MGIMYMGRQRRQHEADTDSKKQRQQHTPQHRQIHHKHDLRNNRRQAGAVKTDIDIPGHMAFMIISIQENSEQNRPDIHDIFSKKGKPKHQTAGSDGMAVHLLPQIISKSDTDQHHDAGIDKRRTDSAHGKIIRDQNIRFLNHHINAPHNLINGLQIEAHKNKVNRNQSQKQELPVSGQRSLFCHRFTPFRMDGISR